MTTSTPVALIPRNILFGNPVKTNPQISPDGTLMAYLAPVNNVLNVWVGAIGSDDYQPVTRDEDRGVRFYFWAADNKHILYLQDAGGNENWRLYATNLDTRETRDLTPVETVQVQVVEHNKHFPNELLIGLNKDNPQVHDVYHLDLTFGELAMVAQNPGNIIGWVADANFKVRGALAAMPEGGSELLVRADEQADWKTLLIWNADDMLTSAPLSFSLDGQFLYIEDSRKVNASRLVKMNIATGDTTLTAAHHQYDVGRVMIHPDTYEIQAVPFNKDPAQWPTLDNASHFSFPTLLDINQSEFSL